MAYHTSLMASHVTGNSTDDLIACWSKQHIKVSYYINLWGGESNGHQWIPLSKGSTMRKVFSCQDVFMVVARYSLKYRISHKNFSSFFIVMWFLLVILSFFYQNRLPKWFTVASYSLASGKACDYQAGVVKVVTLMRFKSDPLVAFIRFPSAALGKRKKQHEGQI